ncbi:MAG TPA: hypothetical protein VJL28_00755 [Gemmatimonadaceae bacterium]|nr:hypothetical protein [Gemmatimonadaceae bacterium]
MRTTIDIDTHLLKRLRAEAHRRGVPLKELLSGVLRRGLDEPLPARRARYRCPTYSMGTPARPYDLDKAFAIATGLGSARSVARRFAPPQPSISSSAPHTS